MNRFILKTSLALIGFIFSYNIALAAPGDLLWRVDVPSNGSYSDPISGITSSLDSGTSRYLFTSVATDGNYVYTGRAYKGPWTGTGGGSIQIWRASDKELIETTLTCGCLGVYDLELKVYNGDGLGLVRLYVYKPGKLEIRDKDTLAPIAGDDNSIDDATAPLCSTACNDSGVSPGAFNGSITKRTKVTGDGVTIFAEQTGPDPTKPMTLSMGGATIASESSWATDIIPAPAWHTTMVADRYFGAEAIALSPDHAYVYIVGGRESSGVYSSRMEKRELGTLLTPVATITATPQALPYGGGSTVLEWSSVDADSCNVTSVPAGASFTGTSGSETVSVSANTTFYVDCTRISDGAVGSDNVPVTVDPNQLPVAVISDPTGDIAITQGSNVSFTGDTSYDPNGSIIGYDWRSIDIATVGASCATAANFSSAANPSLTFSSAGIFNVYLVVQDNESAFSTCAQRTITVPPQCSDGIDNDGDGDFDTDDPGCHFDSDAGNPATYVPQDNSEANCGDGICTRDDGEGFLSCRLDCRVIFNSF